MLTLGTRRQVINTGDAFEFLTGGYYKPTIHRVIQPPVDQRQSTRLGIVYFGMPHNAVKLLPLSESPVLQAAELQCYFDDAHAPTMHDWRRARVRYVTPWARRISLPNMDYRTYGMSDLKKGRQAGVEEEYVNGVLVKHYN